MKCSVRLVNFDLCKIGLLTSDSSPLLSGMGHWSLDVSLSYPDLAAACIKERIWQ